MREILTHAQRTNSQTHKCKVIKIPNAHALNWEGEREREKSRDRIFFIALIWPASTNSFMNIIIWTEWTIVTNTFSGIVCVCSSFYWNWNQWQLEWKYFEWVEVVEACKECRDAIPIKEKEITTLTMRKAGGTLVAFIYSFASFIYRFLLFIWHYAVQQ